MNLDLLMVGYSYRDLKKKSIKAPDGALIFSERYTTPSLSVLAGVLCYYPLLNPNRVATADFASSRLSHIPSNISKSINMLLRGIS